MPVTEFKLEYQNITSGSKGRVAAIVVAAGSATRMGGQNKQFLSIGGEPVILRTLKVFQNCDAVSDIILVAKGEDIPKLQTLIDQNKISKVTDIVEGGSTRAESVKNGIARCSEDISAVLIHDGARPLVTKEVIERVIDGVWLYKAAACGIRVKDTVKIINNTGKIISTPDRDTLIAIQTPQGFDLKLYKDALKKVGDDYLNCTDDCAIVERAGQSVYVVEGDNCNIKITTPEDVLIAESILKMREEEK